MEEHRITACCFDGFKLERMWEREGKIKKNPLLVCRCNDCGRLASLTPRNRKPYVPDIMPGFFKMLFRKVKK